MCRWLEARGHQAKHFAELGLLAATDREIASIAERDGWTLISKDEDFLVLRLPDRFAFLWLRIGNATNRALETCLEARWPVIEGMLRAGELLVEAR